MPEKTLLKSFVFRISGGTLNAGYFDSIEGTMNASVSAGMKAAGRFQVPLEEGIDLAINHWIKQNSQFQILQIEKSEAIFENGYLILMVNLLYK